MIYAIVAVTALILPFAILKAYEMEQVRRNKKKIWESEYEYEYE